MKTSRLQLNQSEVAAILPALEAIVNILASARLGSFPRLDPRVQFKTVNGSRVYAQAEYDETMAGYLLAARNKLKWINPSRKVRLNSFHLAAVAFAFRMVKQEKLATKEVLAKVPGLANKLERFRKQAKRAAIKQTGGDAYGEQAECWRRFLQYIHSILCFRPTFWKSSGPRLLHRDRREKLLELAREVAPTVDPAQLRHLVDLAKSEVLRDRHRVTLGMLASDDTLGRKFMADFLRNRIDPYLLAPEFQSLDILQSTRYEQLKKALVLDEPDEPDYEVQVAEMIVEEQGDTTEVPPPSVESPAEVPAALLVSAISKTLPTWQELAEHYAQWLIEELDPEDWETISRLAHSLAREYTSRYVRQTTSKTIAEAIVEAKPIERKTVHVAVLSIEVQHRDAPLTALDFINFYAEWGASWLLAVNPDRITAGNATVEGLRLAREQWASLDPSTRQCKLDAIYLRNSQ
jgi:hypothetical protein